MCGVGVFFFVFFCVRLFFFSGSEEGGEKKGSEQTQMEELVGKCRSEDNGVDSVESALWTGHEDDLGWTLGGCDWPYVLKAESLWRRQTYK